MSKQRNYCKIRYPYNQENVRKCENAGQINVGNNIELI